LIKPRDSSVAHHRLLVPYAHVLQLLDFLSVHENDANAGERIVIEPRGPSSTNDTSLKITQVRRLR
jgi:hypothetical protein